MWLFVDFFARYYNEERQGTPRNANVRHLHTTVDAREYLDTDWHDYSLKMELRQDLKALARKNTCLVSLLPPEARIDYLEKAWYPCEAGGE